MGNLENGLLPLKAWRFGNGDLDNLRVAVIDAFRAYHDEQEKVDPAKAVETLFGTGGEDTIKISCGDCGRDATLTHRQWCPRRRADRAHMTFVDGFPRSADAGPAPAQDIETAFHKLAGAGGAEAYKGVNADEYVKSLRDGPKPTPHPCDLCGKGVPATVSHAKLCGECREIVSEPDCCKNCTHWGDYTVFFRNRVAFKRCGVGGSVVGPKFLCKDNSHDRIPSPKPELKPAVPEVGDSVKSAGTTGTILDSAHEAIDFWRVVTDRGLTASWHRSTFKIIAKKGGE